MAKVAELRDGIREGVERRVREMPPARRLRFELALETLERELGRSGELLDAGCGEGLFSVQVAERFPGWTILGVDLRDDDLEQARARGDGLPNVRFEHLDLTGDLGRDRFDAVAALECLEEIEDDAAAAVRLAEALRPGGLFLAHVPRAGWKPVLPGSETTWRHEVRHGYTEDELAEKLSRAGLDLVRIEATTRGTVKVALEVRDRIKRSSLKLRALAYPWMLAAVRLERLGLTWGSPRGLFVEARKR